jgi:hypothetical protein
LDEKPLVEILIAAQPDLAQLALQTQVVYDFFDVLLVFLSSLYLVETDSKGKRNKEK